jgi:hypothetical protein
MYLSMIIIFAYIFPVSITTAVLVQYIVVRITANSKLKTQIKRSSAVIGYMLYVIIFIY